MNDMIRLILGFALIGLIFTVLLFILAAFSGVEKHISEPSIQNETPIVLINTQETETLFENTLYITVGIVSFLAECQALLMDENITVGAEFDRRLSSWINETVEEMEDQNG